MFDENKADLITLTDENNQEKTFEILDTIEDDRGKFYALSPIRENISDLACGSADYLILKVNDVDGEIELEEPENSSLLYDLQNEFEDHFNALFE